jgi:hypothetical protein
MGAVMQQEPDIFDRMAAQAAGVEASPLLSKEELPALYEKAFDAQNLHKPRPTCARRYSFC